MSKETPDCLKKELEFAEGNAQQSAAMVEQLSYELHLEKEKQKLKPIELAPEDREFLVYEFNKGLRKITYVETMDSESFVLHKFLPDRDFVYFWGELPDTEGL